MGEFPGKGLLCPLAGQTCLGEDQCAPAVITASHRQKALSAEYGDDVVDSIRPMCPICVQVESIEVTTSLLARHFMGGTSVDQKNLDDLTDDEMREHVLRNLKLDQPRDF